MAVQEAAALTDAGEQAAGPWPPAAGGRGWAAERRFYSCEERVRPLDLECTAMAWTPPLWSSRLGKVAAAQQLELPFLDPAPEPDISSPLSSALAEDTSTTWNLYVLLGETVSRLNSHVWWAVATSSLLLWWKTRACDTAAGLSSGSCLLTWPTSLVISVTNANSLGCGAVRKIME